MRFNHKKPQANKHIFIMNFQNALCQSEHWYLRILVLNNNINNNYDNVANLSECVLFIWTNWNVKSVTNM